MSNSVSIPEDGRDETSAFLDDVFDRALEALKDGGSLDVEMFLGHRQDLHSEVTEILRIAGQVMRRGSRNFPVIQGYEILSELGRGGMGVVYLARQTSLGERMVAVKVLDSAAVLSSTARKRFLTEVNTLARIRHQGVVSVYEVIQEDNLFAYAMEWVEGRSLMELISNLGLLAGPPGMAEVRQALNAPAGKPDDASFPLFICRIGIDMARALAAVHEAGLLHRDVKPSNILLRTNGTALLGDFGIVREIGGEVLTRAGDFLGTPAYAAPEHLRGMSTDVDARTDVYALGVTLYHALTLRLPFKGKTTPVLLQQIENGAALPLRRANPALPKDLQTIVAVAMDPDPERRYATADAMADDLERLVNLQPIRARPAGLATRTAKLLRRNRKSLAGAVVGGMVILVLSVLLFLYLFHVPGWIESHLRRARLLLLGPVHGERIFVAMIRKKSGGSSPFWRTAPEVVGRSLDEALTGYGKALLFRPWDEEIRLEADTVRLARALLLPARGPLEISGTVENGAPLTARIVRHWSGKGRPPRATGVDLKGAAGIDLRCLGLLAFLMGDVELCNRAWEEMEQQAEPDPFVEASRGVVFLLSEEPAKALHRLRNAFRAFSEAGFLCAYLADAAVQCGEYELADRSLERARKLDLQDPFHTLKRVEADLHAVRGENGKARDLYAWVVHHHQVPVAMEHFGKFLMREGDLEEAVQVLYFLIQLWPDTRKYQRLLNRAADAWWDSLAPHERWKTVRMTLDGGLMKWILFTDLLRAYEPEPKPSSSARAGLTLGHLAARLKRTPLMPEDGWTLPSGLKDLVAMNWLSPAPKLGISLFHILHGMLATLDRLEIQGTRFSHPVAAPGWVSMYNGPENNRRARGQILGRGWRRVWQSPRRCRVDRMTCGVLVKNGIVVFRNDPENPGQFAGFRLDDGKVLWTREVGPSRSVRPGCISGNRVFLPLSINGEVSPPHLTQRVTCLHLDTGQHQWTWDTGIVGRVSALQVLESRDASIPSTILFTVRNSMGISFGFNVKLLKLDSSWRNPGFLNGRLVALDATWSGSTGPDPRSPPFLCQGPAMRLGPITRPPLSVFPLMGQDHEIRWKVFFHRQRMVKLDSLRQYRSWFLRVYDALTLAPSPAPFPCHPFLSDSTPSTLKGKYVQSPLVIAGGNGYLFETGGFLRAYDLQNGRQLWCRKITETLKERMTPLVLTGAVVMVDRETGEAAAYARSDGALLWRRTLPARPAIPGFNLESGCILDQDIILLPLRTGDVYGLDRTGTLIGPVHHEAGVLNVIAAGGKYLVSTRSELICYRAEQGAPLLDR